VSGYHFHFITEDRGAGGHLLECEIARGELRVDHESDLDLELPAGVVEAVPDLTPSRQDELERVENA
jgi:acetolactate decarboxylase